MLWFLDLRLRERPASSVDKTIDHRLSTRRARRTAVPATLAFIAGTFLTAGFTAHAQEPLSIAGRIIGPDSEPIAGASVEAFRDPAAPYASVDQRFAAMFRERESFVHAVGTTTSAADGVFHLAVPAAGWYTLRVSAAGRATMEFSNQAAPAAGVEVELPKSTVARAVVREADGKPVAGARLEMRRVHLREFDRQQLAIFRPPLIAVTGTDDGELDLSGLAEGTYSLTITARTYPTLERRIFDVTKTSPREITFEYPPLRWIHGLVRGEDDHPVSGATVRIDPVRTAPERVSRGNLGLDRVDGETDLRGRFTVRAFDGDRYRVTVFHPDFLAKTIVDYDASAGPLIVPLAQGCSTRGRVVDAATGEPVAGASISVHDPAGPRNAISGVDGRFQLRGLEPRTPSLLIGAPGYAPGSISSHIRCDEADDTPEHTVRLDRLAAVRGRVVDEDGAAIVGAGVLVWTSDVSGEKRGRVTGRGTTARDGSFEITGVLPKSRLWLAVEAAPYVAGTSEDFEIQPGATSVEPDFILVRGGTLAGRITDDTGGPVRSATIRAFTPGTTEDRDAATPDLTTPATVSDARGEFRLPSLSPGGYDVEVSAPDRDSKLIPGVEVAKGETAALGTIELPLRARGRIRGIVCDPKGEPLRTVEIAFDPPGLHRTVRIPLDAEGMLDWQDAPLGDYRVELRNDDHSLLRRTVPLSIGAEKPVELGRIQLLGEGRIRGRVLHDGKPVARARIQLLAGQRALLDPPAVIGSGNDPLGRGDRRRPGAAPPESSPAIATTATDGTFSFAGLHLTSLLLRCEKTDLAVQVVRVDTRTPEESEHLVLELAPGGTLEGMLVDSAGQPLPDAFARVSDESGSGEIHYATAKTAADGSFRITDLPAGEFRVRGNAIVRRAAAPRLRPRGGNAEPERRLRRNPSLRFDETVRIESGETKRVTILAK